MRLLSWESSLEELLLILMSLLMRFRKELLKRLANTTIAVLVLSLLGWWFIPVTSNATLVASLVVYEIPAIFLAAVCALAAKQLA